MLDTNSYPNNSFRAVPREVLVNLQLGESIGMAARAMANFGLFDLQLVARRVGRDTVRKVAVARLWS